uniref:LRRCT domain-containing protein n=1 Tax=Branchiostoma floridae TaxID=7739 RepID=C3YKH7_BRAFL|eukprot:XP_002603210.1 hypothetical protein BRAFLDRAFT_93378 [Branchiostoma floridae]
MKMSQSKMLLLFVLISNHLLILFVPVSSQRCPDSCFTDFLGVSRRVLKYDCPDKNGEGSPCSWEGQGGTYSFPVCLDAVPTGFNKNTRSILITAVRNPTLLERSFPNISSIRVLFLEITKTNISTIQPGAFRGLSYVIKIYLQANRITSLEADTFVGLESLTHLFLDKNSIAAISQHAFRGLPLLKVVQLSHNCLRFLPVDAILQLKAFTLVNLATNHIATINSSVLRLRHFRLVVTDNRLRCDESLTWFICNLQAHKLEFILSQHSLSCASPAHLRDALLTTMGRDVSQTSTYRSLQGTGSVPCGKLSVTTAEIISAGLKTVNMYNETVPTEHYYTETPYTINMAVSEHTTGMGQTHIIFLGKNPTVNEHERTTQLLLMVCAVVVPLLLVLASGFVIFFCGGKCLDPNNIPVGTTEENPASSKADGSHHIEPYAVVYDDSVELHTPVTSSATGRPGNPPTSEDDYTIQPYAVSYMDVSGKGVNGKLPPYATTTLSHDQTSEDNDDIQPYAVTYMDVSGKGKNGKLPPYATTTLARDHTTEDRDTIQPHTVTCIGSPGQNNTSKIHPYASIYPDSLQVARNRSMTMENITNEQETNVKQPVAHSMALSLPTDVAIELKYEKGHLFTTVGRGPYGVEDRKEMSASGVLYNTATEDNSTSHIL